MCLVVLQKKSKQTNKIVNLIMQAVLKLRQFNLSSCVMLLAVIAALIMIAVESMVVLEVLVLVVAGAAIIN